ncbi:MAG: hypothetical protein ACYTGA_13740, partial [Planctomycetota bacterium]
VTPIVSGWDEIDLDPASQNTGAFLNTPGDASSYIVNADGNQVAFLIAQYGNAFQQKLPNIYQVGRSYRLTAAVGISFYSEPEDPGDPLELVFYYEDGDQKNRDIAKFSVPFKWRSATHLDDFTVLLPTVQLGYGWAGENIRIAMRGTSDLGGTWIIDNVRVEEHPSTPNFTTDSIVNLADFAKMAAEWLSCGEMMTDVTGEGCVNEADLLILMEYWLDDV